MKKTVAIIIIFLTASIASTAQIDFKKHDILPPDPSVGRLDNVFSGIAMVRISSLRYLEEFEKTLENNNAKIAQYLLEPATSFTYGKRKNFKKIHSSAKISNIIRAEESLLRSFYIVYENDEIPESFCKRLESSCGIVECAEPFFIPMPLGEYVPDDPLVSQQEMFNTIRAYEAWDIYKGSDTIIIGVGDTGIDQDHEDLVNSIDVNEDEIPGNEIDDDNNGYLDDHIGYNFSYIQDKAKPGNTSAESIIHGTPVAGLAAATTDNGIGIAGTGFKTKFFPMKCSPENVNGIIYGYESIIYSVQNGFDIVNCSWGGFSYSCIRKAVIDYAIAADVLIVGGAGNHRHHHPFYPAAYEGVVAVGGTEPDDKLYANTGFGYWVDIMTPGEFSTTTHPDNVYSGFCCTSAASPIGAAAAAIIRGQHPELNVFQVHEFLRQSGDDIGDITPELADLIALRLNLYKAVSVDPMSIPGIRPVETRYFDQNGNPVQRLHGGDVVDVEISAYNHLGQADNLDINLRVVMNDSGMVSILKNMTHIDLVPREDSIKIAGFRIRINNDDEKEAFLRFEISGPDDYSDFFMVPINSSQSYTNFSNSKIRFTASDNAKYGYYDEQGSTLGEGFSLEGSCSVLYEGNLMAAEDNTKTLTSGRKGPGEVGNDFTTLEVYDFPERNSAVFSDEDADINQKIGIEIKSEIYLSPDKAFARIDFSVENTSGHDLKDLSTGIFFDWDVLSSDENYGEILDDIELSAGFVSAAGVIRQKDEKTAVGTMAFSRDPELLPAMSFFSSRDTYDENGYSPGERILHLQAGKRDSMDGPGDLAQVIGMQSVSGIDPDGQMKFHICLCIAENEDEDNSRVRSLLKDCAGTITSVENENFVDELTIYPQPADDMINLRFPDDLMISSIGLFDIFGNRIEGKLITQSSGITEIDVSGISSGVYFLKIMHSGGIIYRKIIISGNS